MKTNYRAPWDLKLIIITSVLVIILVGATFFRPGFLSSAIALAIIFGCAAFGIYGYGIQDDQLKILRMGWATKIDLDSITNVVLKPYVMMGSIRTFGNGGLFGYIGYYKNSILGSYRAYVTKRKNTVLIETEGGSRYVVSPEEPAKFVNNLEDKISDSTQ